MSGENKCSALDIALESNRVEMAILVQVGYLADGMGDGKNGWTRDEVTGRLRALTEALSAITAARSQRGL